MQCCATWLQRPARLGNTEASESDMEVWKINKLTNKCMCLSVARKSPVTLILHRDELIRRVNFQTIQSHEYFHFRCLVTYVLRNHVPFSVEVNSYEILAHDLNHYSFRPYLDRLRQVMLEEAAAIDALLELRVGEERWQY